MRQATLPPLSTPSCHTATEDPACATARVSTMPMASAPIDIPAPRKSNSFVPGLPHLLHRFFLSLTPGPRASKEALSSAVRVARRGPDVIFIGLGTTSPYETFA